MFLQFTEYVLGQAFQAERKPCVKTSRQKESRVSWEERQGASMVTREIWVKSQKQKGAQRCRDLSVLEDAVEKAPQGLGCREMVSCDFIEDHLEVDGRGR